MTKDRTTAIALLMALGLLAPPLLAGENVVETGKVHYSPAAAKLEALVAPQFQMPAHDFTYRARSLGIDSLTLQVWDVTFPSPVVTPHEVNNTMHCEYYQPQGVKGKRPAVIVLHILGGDFALSRLFCNAIAQKGTAALFVKLPYYGERRPLGSTERLVSPDPERTIANMTQAVLDIRQATAWLAARDEIDADELGVMGISLGGITAALAASAEPRLKNVCMMLAGGDMGLIVTESKLLVKHREEWLKNGQDPAAAIAKIRVIDPLTYAANVRGRRMLMLNADADEVIPRKSTELLWHALGEPPIEWMSGTHYSVIRHLLMAITRVSDFFAAP